MFFGQNTFKNNSIKTWITLFREEARSPCSWFSCRSSRWEQTTNSTHISNRAGIEPRPSWWEVSAVTTGPSRYCRILEVWKKIVKARDLCWVSIVSRVIIAIEPKLYHASLFHCRTKFIQRLSSYINSILLIRNSDGSHYLILDPVLTMLEYAFCASLFDLVYMIAV